MSPIKFRCSRCGARHSVAESKAGKKGRCPTCGGPLHVPTLEQVVQKQQQAIVHHRILGTVGVVIVIIALVAGYTLFGPISSVPVEKPTKRTQDQSEEEKAKAQLAKLRLIDGLKAGIVRYEGLLEQEQILRVRDIGAKLRSYERVTVHEHDLREELLNARRKRMELPPEGGGMETDEWQLDVPLNEIEREGLRRLSETIEQQAKVLVRELRQVGVTASVKKDPLGRTLLDHATARGKLAVRRQEVVDSYSEGVAGL